MRLHNYVQPDSLTLYRTPRDGIAAALDLLELSIYYPPKDGDYLRVVVHVAAVLSHTGPGGDARYDE